MTASAASSRGQMATAAALITAGNLLSRVLGLARESVIAALFGKSQITSVFATAATVPTMVYDLVIGGAVSAAMIPVFSEYASRDDEAGRVELGKVVGSVAVIALAALSLVCLILIPLAPWLSAFLGVSAASPAFADTTNFIRLVIPSVVFLGLSAVVTALLYSRNAYAVPAFAVGAYNLGIIVCALALTPSIGAASLVVGVLAGAAGQLGLQLLGLRGSAIRLAVDLRHPAVRGILRLYAPVALGLVISQLGVVIDRNLAWRTGEDSLATMRFATTLVQLPLGLVATATSFAALPALSRLAGASDGLQAFKRVLAQASRLALIAILPATTVLVALRAPVVQALFERLAFDRQATLAVSDAFMYYSPQLPFVAIDQLLIFAFYARKDTKTPMLVGLLGVGIYLASGLTLAGPAAMGVNGLALANTLQNSAHALVLGWLLWRSVGRLSGFGVEGTLVRCGLAALAAGAVAALAGGLIPTGGGLALLAGGIVLAAAIAGVSYIAVLGVMRATELTELLGMARKVGARLGL